MGYTNNYYCWTPSPEQTQAVINDIEQLTAQSGAALHITRLDGKIEFNGTRQHSADTFEWPPSPVPPESNAYLDHPEWLTFYCKTDRRKYDMVVFAALLAIKHHVPNAMVETDDYIDLASAVYDIRHRQYSRGSHSVVELLQKTHMNEFSPQHQRGLKLYEQTFPERAAEQTIPWQPVI